MDVTFGSVCSGIEAASVAWHDLGWRAAWLSEIDKAASEVLKYRFPDVPNHGDMLTLAAKVRAREIPAPDVLVGGTPCQSFSLAGLRLSLDDPRGQLTLAFVALANAIDEVRAADGKPPVIIVWENVPGVFTAKQNAFGCFLAGLVGESTEIQPSGKKWTNAGAVLGPQRTAAWIVKDAQYFGVAQRRRRVFLVASACEGFDPAAILFEFEGVRRDIAPSRTPGEAVAHDVVPSLTSSGRGVARPGETRGQDPVVAERHLYGAAGVELPAPVWWDGRDISATLDAVLYKGQTMPEKNRFPAVLLPVAVGGDIAHSLRADGFDASEDGTGRGTPIIAFPVNLSGTQHASTEDMAPSLGARNPTAVAFTCKDYGQDAGEVSPTLRSMTHDGSHANGGGQVAVAYAFQPRIARNGRGDMGDLVNALTAQAGETGKGDAAPCVAQMFPGEISPCLRAGGNQTGGDRPPGTDVDTCETLVPVAFDTTQISSPHNYSNPQPGDPCHPLAAGAHPPAVAIARGMLETAYKWCVRRLMPIECERLQGFPDNWTLVPTGKNGKLAADGPRYKQLGNSMAVPCMRWIGERIDRALRTRASMIGHNGGPALDEYDALLG